MGEWLVRVEGHKFDLQALATELAPDVLKVTEQEGTYFLQAREFETRKDEGEVRARAEEMVQSLNGLGRALLSGFERVAISGVTLVESETVRHNYQTFRGNTRLRSNMTAELHGGTEASTRKPDDHSTARYRAQAWWQGPLKLDAPSYMERRADRELYQTPQVGERGVLEKDRRGFPE
jgi:hypothetical protein